MNVLNLHELELREPFPGCRVRFVHSTNMTLAFWELEAGALLPEHSHPHEQVTDVRNGDLELTVAGEAGVLGPGTVAIIPSNALHSGRAATRCSFVDVFYPVREDLK